MARFNYDTADNYGGSGGAGFFSLKDDGDQANIRYLYNQLADIEGFAVHEIEVNGKKRYVNCLREYGDPIESCPLCAERYKQIAKLFLYIWDEDTQEVKIWDRGKTYYKDLSALSANIKSFVGTVFQITRSGKKGDTGTKYTNWPLSTDDATLEEFPELTPILGSLVLDKTFEELDFFLDNGFFEEVEAPQSAPPAQDKGVRNPAGRQQPGARPTGNAPAQNAGAPQRRTPANTTANNTGAPNPGRGARRGNPGPQDRF